MQGKLTEDNGACVNAAIVKFTKIMNHDEAGDESTEEAVAYGKTDEEGRFSIHNIDPEADYIIEVLIPKPEPDLVCSEPDLDLSEQDMVLSEPDLVCLEPDKTEANADPYVKTHQEGIVRNCLYYLDRDMKETLGRMKNNLW